MRPLELPPLPTQRGIVASDFTGGLDYTKGGYGISAKHSPEALNVNWLMTGGFELRRAVRRFSITPLPSDVVKLGYFETSTQQWSVAACSNGSVWISAGFGQPYSQLLPAGLPPRTSLYQINNKLYMSNGASQTATWDGNTVVPLGLAWNTSPVGSPIPTGGNMPMGRYLAVFGGHMHVAHINEPGIGVNPNRIRQSFAMVNRTGEQDYREDDYFDIDSGKDGQSIVGLATVGQKLFAIRQHSLYQIQGSDYTEYAFPEVSSDRGASGEQAFVAFSDSLWCWDSTHGLHVTSGYSDANGSIVREVVTGGLRQLLEDGEFINPTTVSVGTDGVRILVSSDTKTWGRRTYAYDPNMKCWAAWDLSIGAFGVFSRSGAAEPLQLCATVGRPQTYVCRLGVKSSSDEMGGGAQPIPAMVKTTWLDDDRPMARKLARNITYLYESGSGIPTVVEARKDWGFETLFSSTLPGTVPTDIFDVGTDSVLSPVKERRRPGADPTDAPCQEFPPGTPEVGPDATPTQNYSQPMTSCAFYSVQLTFRISSPAQGWRVRAVSLAYQADARRN